MEKLDEFDIKIIKELEKDGRIAYSTIASNLKISNTMVHQRIHKLTEQGILAGIQPIINEKKVGYDWGAFTGITVLILTLYFIIGLPQATNFGLRFVPATRRERVSKLTFAIIARVGSFVGSQIAIAFMAAIFVLILSFVLGLPSPFAIAMIVLVCGFIPLIGHYIGSTIVTLIALTQSLLYGVIAFVAYIVYVQIENYVVTPRIMKRALNVPGAVTIIAALLGTSLLGLIGGLLAVPIAASIILILEEVVFPQTDKN